MNKSEKKLHLLFDYQIFQCNDRLDDFLSEYEEEAALVMDDSLFAVAGGKENELDKKEKNQENK